MQNIHRTFEELSLLYTPVAGQNCPSVGLSMDAFEGFAQLHQKRVTGNKQWLGAP